MFKLCRRSFLHFEIISQKTHKMTDIITNQVNREIFIRDLRTGHSGNPAPRSPKIDRPSVIRLPFLTPKVGRYDHPVKNSSLITLGRSKLGDPGAGLPLCGDDNFRHSRKRNLESYKKVTFSKIWLIKIAKFKLQFLDG